LKAKGIPTCRNTFYCFSFYHLVISVIWPAPTVLPPSRIAKRRPTFIATGTINLTVIVKLSPGITISCPSGRKISPVTSVVLM